MKKIVFMNPLLLFFLYFLLCLPAAMMTLPAGENPTNIGALALGYIGLLLSMILGFFWPYTVHKYLARKMDHEKAWDPNKFDKVVLVLLFLIPAFVVLDIRFRDTLLYNNFSFALELFGSFVILILFLVLGLIIWSTAKLLKGGIGTFLALLYWPLTAAFVQNRIKELYSEKL